MKRFYLALALVFGGQAVHALDTIEPFDKGLSNAEFYYGRAEGNVQGLSLAVGGGVSRLLNPVVSPEYVIEEGESSLGFTFENIMNVYDGPVAIDLVPGVSTDLEVVSVGVGVEVTLPLRGLVPYLQGRPSMTLADSQAEMVAVFGTMIPLAGWAELFAEAGRRWTVDGNSDRGGLGLNVLITESTEMISEVVYEDGFSARFGIIQTL